MTALRPWAPAILMLALASAARAQTVDYTAAEQMFGEPVTLAATGKPQRASEAPASMHIITADDIRRSGATDIPSILRFVPGIDVRRYGQFDTAVGIRGYNTALNPRVLVLLDGRQVYQDDYGYTLWSQIPVALSEIRQIEIVRGPNAALYGFNAVSGVINIVTYDPLRDARNAVDLRGGTQDQVYGESVATIRIPDRFGLRVSAKGTRADEFSDLRRPDDSGLVNPFAPDIVERPGVKTGAADMRYRLTDKVELGLSASVGAITTDFYSDIGFYSPMDVTTDSLRALLTAETSLGIVQLDAYRNAVDFNPGKSGYDLSWKQNVTVLKASDLVRLGDGHTIRIGAEYRDNSLFFIEDYYGGETYSQLIAGSAMWNWQIRPDLSMTHAVRVDAMTVDRSVSPFSIDVAQYYEYARPAAQKFVESSFNSALLYTPTDFDTFRVNVARALQLPSLVSLNYYYLFDPLVSNPGGSFGPGAVMNYEVGYSRGLPGIGSQLSLSIFAQDTDKTVGSPFRAGLNLSADDELLTFARNFPGSSAVGGEIGIDGHSESGWRWNLGYAFAAIEDQTPAEILFEAPSIDFAAQNPVHSVTAGFGFTWDRLEFDAKARWQSRFEETRYDDETFKAVSIDVPDYVTLDARAGYKVSDAATLSVTAEQLNAARIVTSAGRPSQRRVLAGLKIEF